jgi:hypothetical protein
VACINTSCDYIYLIEWRENPNNDLRTGIYGVDPDQLINSEPSEILATASRVAKCSSINYMFSMEKLRYQNIKRDEERRCLFS